jgi:hypothetical protein
MALNAGHCTPVQQIGFRQVSAIRAARAFRSACVSPAFLRCMMIGEIAAETPALRGPDLACWCGQVIQEGDRC